MIAKSALPKALRNVVAKNVACGLFPLRHKFHHVGSSDLSLHEDMHVVRHYAKRMDKDAHRIGDTLQRFDGSLGATCILEYRPTVFAADGNEIDSPADIFLPSKTNILTWNTTHWQDGSKEPNIVVWARFRASLPDSPITSHAFASDAQRRCRHPRLPPAPPRGPFPPLLHSQSPAASTRLSHQCASRSPPLPPPLPAAAKYPRCLFSPSRLPAAHHSSPPALPFP